MITVGNICKNSFRLNELFVANYIGAQPEWGPLGYVTYKRTYARKLDENDPDSLTEEWWQTVQRVVEGTFSIQKNHCNLYNLPWDSGKAQRTAQKMFEAMWNFKFLPPGRGLWAMGTKNIEKIGGMALNNCGFVSTKDMHADPSKPFCFLMDASMLGVGVGFDTLAASFDNLENRIKIKTPECQGFSDYVVPDSREGWVNALRLLLRAYLLGEELYTYDFSEVRPAGALIKGFGGTASGPKDLIILLNSIKTLLSERDNEYLTSTDVVDIQNMIGKCVVAGNVRRSAELALGDPGDTEFATLKQDYDKLGSHRWASNNSITAAVGMDYEYHGKQTAINGEPGYVWLDNMRQFGRTKDLPNNKDHRVMGANPCVEQTLESYELCCLVETYIARHKTLAEYMDTLKLAYMYAKTVTLVPTHWQETNAVMMRNRRIGCSQTGITNAFEDKGKREVFRWCDLGYEFICGLDKQYSEWLCVPESIKKTSVKPSGTLSLLPPNTNPGIHYGPSQYYIRRIRIAKNSPITKALEVAGYHVEPAINQPDTVVASFPVHDVNYVRGEGDVSMWEQLENAAQYQYYWADNCVSVTIKFSKKEAADVPRALELYEGRLKAVSFLPTSDHGYDQAPLEPISAEVYTEMAASINPELLMQEVSGIRQAGDGGKTMFCDGDKCELGTIDMPVNI